MGLTLRSFLMPWLPPWNRWHTWRAPLFSLGAPSWDGARWGEDVGAGVWGCGVAQRNWREGVWKPPPLLPCKSHRFPVESHWPGGARGNLKT